MENIFKKPLVYIASPYTLGDKTENLRRHAEAAHELLDNKYPIIAPLAMGAELSKYNERTYEEWMTLCISLLSRCDCVLRIPGVSSGADREVLYASKNRIPVFYSVATLIYYDESIGIGANVL